VTAADQQDLLMALQSDEVEDRVVAAFGALAWIIAEIRDCPERALAPRSCRDALEHAHRCQHQIEPPPTRH